MKKSWLFLIGIIIIFILQFFIVGSVFCDKRQNVCSVKSLFESKSFNYSNIKAFSCGKRSRNGYGISDFTLVFYEEPNIVNGAYASAKYYDTLYFLAITDFTSRYFCQRAGDKFKHFQNSDDERFRMRGFSSILLEILIFIVFIVMIFRLKDKIVFGRYKNKK